MLLLTIEGRLKEAAEAARQLQTVEPYVPAWNANTATVFWVAGETDAAIALTQSLPQDVGDNRRSRELARIYASLGRYREAAELLDKLPAVTSAQKEAARLLRMAPNSPDAQKAPYLGPSSWFISLPARRSARSKKTSAWRLWASSPPRACHGFGTHPTRPRGKPNASRISYATSDCRNSGARRAGRRSAIPPPATISSAVENRDSPVLSGPANNRYWRDSAAVRCCHHGRSSSQIRRARARRPVSQREDRFTPKIRRRRVGLRRRDGPRTDARQVPIRCWKLAAQDHARHR